jgi:hypothetical protein
MNMTVINIIPDDYEGSPHNALGYAWANYETKTPGHDVVVGRTSNGIDWRGAAESKMAELDVTEAYVNCMWCGGFDGAIKIECAVETVEQPAPLTMEEVAANEHAAEQADLEDLDRQYEKHPGWCKKCHSFCYGDCLVNE